jgi:hypothetical protein
MDLKQNHKLRLEACQLFLITSDAYNMRLEDARDYGGPLRWYALSNSSDKGMEEPRPMNDHISIATGW